ncbi:MAG: TusE/DsrC/DsvC family sulfur relay protein [Gammaproteobacteria bacterium]
MNTAATEQQLLALDEYGLLINPDDWNENVALTLATQLGIENLTADHWKVIQALRQHYEKFGSAPAMHNICRSNGQKSDWIHNLFNNCLNAWLVAGLPDPGEEAKSYLSDM